jgi:hypothetical protein
VKNLKKDLILNHDIFALWAVNKTKNKFHVIPLEWWGREVDVKEERLDVGRSCTLPMQHSLPDAP